MDEFFYIPLLGFLISLLASIGNGFIGNLAMTIMWGGFSIFYLLWTAKLLLSEGGRT